MTTLASGLPNVVRLTQPAGRSGPASEAVVGVRLLIITNVTARPTMSTLPAINQMAKDELPPARVQRATDDLAIESFMQRNDRGNRDSERAKNQSIRNCCSIVSKTIIKYDNRFSFMHS